MITLWHPFESPTLNRFHKKHWHLYSSWKKQCVQWAVFAHNSRGYDNASAICVVHFDAYRHRYLDTDNLIGGFKALRDALVEAKFLVDDSPKWAQFTYDQHLVGISPTKEAGTKITIAVADALV